MKNRWNTWLLMGIIIPLVLHFWPFAWWGRSTLVILRIIPAISAQVLLCRVGKQAVIKEIPLAITGALVLWICYVYFVPPHGSSAVEFWMLFWDYFSPFFSCLIVYLVFMRRKK